MNQSATTWISSVMLLSAIVLGGCSGNAPAKKNTANATPASETTRSFQTREVKERASQVPEVRTPEQTTSKQKRFKKHRENSITGGNHNRKEALSTFDEWRASLKATVQRFRVSADGVIHIKGEQGTEIIFPAFSFADENGNTVRGEIEIQLKECYNFLSFFADGLNTTTTNRELIETGGMIRLQAFQHGNELELLSDAAGVAMFPKNGEEKPGMQPFYGEVNEDETVSWIAGDGGSAGSSTALLLPVAGTGSAQQSFIPRSSPRLRHTEVTTKKDNDVFARKVTWKLKDSESTLLKWFEETEITDTVLLRHFRHQGLRLTMTLRFKENGKVKKAGFGKKTPPDVARAMEKLLETAPPVDVKKMGRFKPSSIYMLGLRGWTFNAAPLPTSVLAASGIDSLTYGILDESFNILSLNKMGWINCDRFYRDQRPKINFTVIAPEETKMMVLQFTNIRSQMCGQKVGDCWTFFNLPEGEPVKLVAFAVEDDQRLISVHADKISGKGVILDKGRAFTDKELENVLK